eukprot:TRINITY_DN9226_c0_g1_i1.p1 TRINITY_DN9226_c0_g1~~TRINITY_DN9226_c0_g1_i1.p1  ORF type:complete len:633 (+),score=147.00 TRINITY_DN9226_c0_g1_i1:94-1899(+)
MSGEEAQPKEDEGVISPTSSPSPPRAVSPDSELGQPPQTALSASARPWSPPGERASPQQKGLDAKARPFMPKDAWGPAQPSGYNGYVPYDTMSSGVPPPPPPAPPQGWHGGPIGGRAPPPTADFSGRRASDKAPGGGRRGGGGREKVRGRKEDSELFAAGTGCVDWGLRSAAGVTSPTRSPGQDSDTSSSGEVVVLGQKAQVAPVSPPAPASVPASAPQPRTCPDAARATFMRARLVKDGRALGLDATTISECLSWADGEGRKVTNVDDLIDAILSFDSEMQRRNGAAESVQDDQVEQAEPAGTRPWRRQAGAERGGARGSGGSLSERPPKHDGERKGGDTARERTVHVVGIDTSQSEGLVLTRFSVFGSLRKYQMCGDPSQPTRFGFFEYNTAESARKALELDGQRLWGGQLRVSMARDHIRGGRPLPEEKQEELCRLAAEEDAAARHGFQRLHPGAPAPRKQGRWSDATDRASWQPPAEAPAKPKEHALSGLAQAVQPWRPRWKPAADTANSSSSCGLTSSAASVCPNNQGPAEPEQPEDTPEAMAALADSVLSGVAACRAANLDDDGMPLVGPDGLPIAEVVKVLPDNVSPPPLAGRC